MDLPTPPPVQFANLAGYNYNGSVGFAGSGGSPKALQGGAPFVPVTIYGGIPPQEAFYAATGVPASFVPFGIDGSSATGGIGQVPEWTI